MQYYMNNVCFFALKFLLHTKLLLFIIQKKLFEGKFLVKDF